MILLRVRGNPVECDVHWFSQDRLLYCFNSAAAVIGDWLLGSLRHFFFFSLPITVPAHL